MGVNTQLTPVQWGALIAMIILSLFPFVIAPMTSSPSPYVLGLPIWFWIVFLIGVVMYALVVVFVRNIGGGGATEERTAEVS